MDNTSKSNNTNNLSVFGKLLVKDLKEDIKTNTSFKIVQNNREQGDRLFLKIIILIIKFKKIKISKN